MRTFLTVAFLGVALVGTSGCYVTHIEGQKSFAEDLRTRGPNPYIKHDVFRDLEGRVRAIAMAPVVPGSSRQLDARQREILSNFSDQYDHGEFWEMIELSRAGYASAVSAMNYAPSGARTSCRIVPARVDIPALERGSNTLTKAASWRFQRGSCNDEGLAHGEGIARSSDGSTEFTGHFDNGQMVEGVVKIEHPNGDHALYIGGIPADGFVVRGLASYFNVSGYRNHRYGDFDNDGKLNGFGINIRNYTDYMLVRESGAFKDDKLNGFAAFQDARSHGEGKVWNVWIGTFVDDEANGLGAWTNGVDTVSVGEWREGRRNGVEFRQYSDMTGDYHSFGVGQRRNSERHGQWTFTLANSFNSNYPLTEVYNNGTLVDTSDKPAFNMGQIMAFSMGAAIVGASDISSAAKLQIGSALAQDTLAGGGGANLAALQQSYASQIQKASASSGQTGNSASSGGRGGITVEDVTITCPSSGTASTIPVPYRTQTCRRAAIDFATTYACNKLDQQRVARNCTAACGHPQCLQE